MTDEIQKNPESEPVIIEASEVGPEKDPVEDLNNAVVWQRDFAGRAKSASDEIRATLLKYEIDMVAETRLNEVTISIPVSFKDLKPHSPAVAVSAEELK